MKPRDIADRHKQRQDDGFSRETFTLPRAEARSKVKEFRERFPAEAYMTAIDSWRVLPGDRIEFTMKRLRSAD